MSIRSRLAVNYAAGVVLTLLVVGVFVWWQMGTALRGSLETTLQTRADGVLTSLENAGQAGLQEADHTAPGVFVVLFSGNGTLQDATGDAPGGVRPVDGVIETGGRRYLLRTQVASDGTLVVTGADLQQIDASQAALARLLLLVGVFVGTVRVDRTRVEHALGNLVSNALTYGDRGNKVEVRCRIDGEPAARILTVEVLDRGPGLGRDPSSGLFEPFVRGPRATGSGSGLGLATVASAVRAHGGTFGAENRGGGGARFWFTIPDVDAVPSPTAAG